MENQFRQYPLEEDILGALDALGYTQPTEIQAAVIPSSFKWTRYHCKVKDRKRKNCSICDSDLQILPIGSRILRRHLS